jgi:hypothetical protein
VVFQQDGAPPHWARSVREFAFLACIFLGAGLVVVDQLRGLRAHTIFCRLISPCGDTLRTLFTRLLWPPSSCEDTLRTLFIRLLWPPSSCEDTLRTLFTRPLWPPYVKWSSECCRDRNSYTANAGEHLEGNWILLAHLTFHENARMLKLFSILQYWFYRQ